MNKIARRFREQVINNPDKVAVTAGEKSYTYGELNRHADSIACGLRRKCPPHPGHYNVGLLFDDAFHMISAILGAVKAGCAYVPLSPDYPGDRLRYMTSHAELSLILTEPCNREKAEGLASGSRPEILEIGEVSRFAPTFEDIYEEKDRDMMYILYTSGSTGNPKGVMQNQRSVLYFIDRYTENLSITKNDRLTLFASFSHDAAIMDMYGGLLNGAALYPLDIMKLNDFSSLFQWLIKEKITIWHSVPTVYRYFVQALKEDGASPYLRLIVLGGEAVIKHDIDAFRQLRRFPHAAIYNLYGQTESSYNSGKFFTHGNAEKRVTLGKAIKGTELFVVDEDGNEANPFEIGEIILASPYVSPGYWKDDRATREAFQENPGIGRLYRTGDSGRLLEDGEIEFAGRKDSQVKIRGYRVELGEIETLLLKHKDIDEAAAIATREGGTEKNENPGRAESLTAYIVSNKTFSPVELREHLSRRLPDYMVPSYYVQLDRLPLTASGKVDRGALPAPVVDNPGQEYIAPRDDVERKLAEIWSRVLNVDQRIIGLTSNFFELGGHSLKATVLVSKIHKEFHLKFPLAELFKDPTVRGLSGIVKGAAKDKFISIEPSEKKEYYVLSSAQKRLYILQQRDPRCIAYNMLSTFVSDEEPHREKLERVFRDLIHRHETLRTSFEIIGETPVQRVHEDVVFTIEYLTAGGGNPVNSIIDRFVRPFDLSGAPLIRVGIIKTWGTENILIVDIHHIVSDGISHSILVKDFIALYAGEKLPGLRLHYKDFSEWQNKLFASGEIKKQEEYWLREFSGDVPVLDIPNDYPRPDVQSFEGDIVTFSVNQKETVRLKELAKKESATLFMVLLAVYNVLLSKLSGREDIVVGTGAAVRRHADLEKIIGLHVNTLALRNDAAGDNTFSEFLKKVKENAIQAFENRDYLFEDLVEKVAAGRALNRNPLFDTVFLMRNTVEDPEDTPGLKKPGLDMRPYRYKKKTSQFDITFSFLEVNGEIEFSVVYCTKLFNRETIEMFAGNFKEILATVLENDEILLCDVGISQDIQAADTAVPEYDFAF